MLKAVLRMPTLLGALTRRIPAWTSHFFASGPESPSPRYLVNGEWEVVIGLEVHAEINTTTKLFSSMAF